MSFKATGPKTRPERVKPPSSPFDFDNEPLPSTWSNPQPRRRLSTSSMSSTSSTASFHSTHADHTQTDNLPQSTSKATRFSLEEETEMRRASNTLKADANAQFAKADYSSAIGTYDKAVAELPNYLDYELAVLQSNIAACHLKLEQWKEAIQACESGLEGLEREMPMPKPKGEKKGEEKNTTSNDGPQRNGTGKPTNTKIKSSTHDSKTNDNEDDKVIELPPDSTDSELQTHLLNLQLSDTRKADITRIRTKLLLRRARAHSSTTPQTWSTLSSSLSDYTLLSQPPFYPILPGSDQMTVRRALIEIPPQLEKAKEKEVAEMMGKLKELGNGILKPFGLSTDMFKMVQDEKSGGWSMSFDQGGGGKQG